MVLSRLVGESRASKHEYRDEGEGNLVVWKVINVEISMEARVGRDSIGGGVERLPGTVSEMIQEPAQLSLVPPTILTILAGSFGSGIPPLVLHCETYVPSRPSTRPLMRALSIHPTCRCIHSGFTHKAARFH